LGDQQEVSEFTLQTTRLARWDFGRANLVFSGIQGSKIQMYSIPKNKIWCYDIHFL